MCVQTVEQLQKVIHLEGRDIKPIFGICMGNQLMGLAAGCTASKLPFGNRGQNQVIVFLRFLFRVRNVRAHGRGTLYEVRVSVMLSVAKKRDG